MKRTGRMLALVLALAGGPAGPRAAEIEGVTFADRRVVGDRTLELRNVALLRYRYFFKVYVAALYLPAETESARILDDVPRAFEIEYFYGFTAAEFRDSTTDGIRRNLGDSAVARFAPEIAQLNALYRDVEPGDRYALSYAPGKGTTLAWNGRALGTVPGAEFSRAVFSIWFGPEPFDANLKRDLLAEP